MDSVMGVFIISIVGLTSLILPLASVVILISLLRKIEGLEKKVEELSGNKILPVESASPAASTG
jgi:hypothetical protein